MPDLFCGCCFYWLQFTVDLLSFRLSGDFFFILFIFFFYCEIIFWSLFTRILLRLDSKRVIPVGICFCFCRGNFVTTNSGSLKLNSQCGILQITQLIWCHNPNLATKSCVMNSWVGDHFFFLFFFSFLFYETPGISRVLLSLRFIFSTCTENPPSSYTESLM